MAFEYLRLMDFMEVSYSFRSLSKSLRPRSFFFLMHSKLKRSIKPLKSLLNVIITNVSSLQASFADADLEFPSLNKSFSPGAEEEFLATNDNVRKAVLHIAAACEQLVSMVRTPMEVLCDAALCVSLMVFVKVETMS